MSSQSQSEFFDEVIYRTNEIIWWNRQLSKLDDPSLFSNYRDFILKELVEVKGPFIEYVRPPALCDQNIGDFLRSLDYNEIAIEAFSQVLFKGDQSFKLYKHQSETMRLLNESSDPLVLSVPTATGKTESFLFPLLNYCITCNQSGLKGLIIYPTKTLEVDQVNRFVRYLDIINEKNNVRRKITIGIWDGDAPSKVGYDVQSNEIPVGSYLRGLECPKCREKLRISERGQLECEVHGAYPWLRAIRSEIRKGVDILISNPEALDYQYVNPDQKTQTILGEISGQSPLKYIVLDEAHVWTGITGVGIQLLLRRLLHFYDSSDPNLVFLSATISDPEYLGKKLSGKSRVNTVQFTAQAIIDPHIIDFTLIKPCSLPELLQTLAFIKYRTTSTVDLRNSIPNFSNCYNMLKLCDLVEDASTIKITPAGEEILNCISIPNGETLVDADELASLFLESDLFHELWRSIILQKIPEVSKIATYFPQSNDKPSFATLQSLVKSIENESGLSNNISEQILQTCLNLGRPANLLIDKYHYFIKPPRKLFWCKACKKLSTNDICSKCDEIILEIKLCKKCHLPYYATGTPIDDSLKVNENKCPSCSTRLNLIEPNVPYTTFVTFLASTLSRRLASKKVLLFSDSRGRAESIGSDLLANDYSLVAQQLVVRLMLDNNNTILSQKLFSDLYEELKERYYYYFYQHVDRNDTISQNIINQLLEQRIRPLTRLTSYGFLRLFDESIITPKSVSSFTKPLYNIIAHEVYKLLVRRRSFQTKKIKIPGLTPNRVTKSLSRKLPHLRVVNLLEIVTIVLKTLSEDGVIKNLKLIDILTELQDNNIDPKNIEFVGDELERELIEVNQFIEGVKLSSPLFIMDQYQSDYQLILSEDIAYCDQCYSSWPVSGPGALICPKCGGKFSLENRWKNGNEGRLPYQSSTGYYIDHWGNDISHKAFLYSKEDLPYAAVGINRAGIPTSLRGIIEEGFRNKDPKINIISTTPIMELGIDIGTLDVVCQIGIPPTISNYVQRSGRAGRSKGRSSMIITVIRGDHPIDSFYFDRLDEFLVSDDKVNIPDPFKFETILDSHVSTEVMGYLARNPDPQNIYKLAYSNPTRSGNAGQLSRAIITRIRAYVQLIQRRKRVELETHIENVYGKAGLVAFNRLFIQNSEQSVLKKAEETYGRLNSIKNAEVSSSQQQRFLSNWMGKLGLLANYRGTIDQLPLSLAQKGGSSTLEFKSFDYALRENFPGPCDKDGAIFSVEATRYVVSNVTGLNKLLLKGKMCINHQVCPFPYKVYDESVDECPFCFHELDDIQVYEIGTIMTRAARRRGDHFVTYPFISTNVETVSIPSKQTMSFYGLSANIFFDRLKVVTFTAAFEKRYRGRKTTNVYPSKAIISKDYSQIDEEDAIAALLGGSTDDCHHIGYSMNTYGVCIELSKEDLEKRLDVIGTVDQQSLISLIQAFKRAICIVIQCELQDFDVSFSIDEDTLSLFIYDKREGGNNLSERVFNELLGSGRILIEIASIANCPYCSRFCDRCLMIERTPSYMVENDLLDRIQLKRLLGV